MIRTAITDMFGVKYPIICGAMMWICKAEFCAAVSSAGGLGNLTAANYETEDAFRDAIRDVRKITDNPFMVNVTMLPSLRITPEHHRMYLRVCAEEKVAGMEISGAPIDKAAGPEYIDMLKESGVKLFHKVGSLRHAAHAIKAGYDGIYAAGIEEGGHPLDDNVTTMILTRKIASTLGVPVVTVGGIADGATMAAALALGAEGVMMASRFMATKECPIHDNIKQELVQRQEMDTTLIMQSIKLQGRALRNQTVEKILEVESRGGGLEELIPLIAGEKCRNAWQEGDVECAPMMVGQSIGLIGDVPSCPELLERMNQEAEAVLERLGSRIVK